MKNSYVDSGKVTADGAVIYNKQTGKRGRPARYIMVGDKHVAYNPVKVKAVKAVAPVTPVAVTADAVV